jgi:hypothetical protein
MGTTDNLQKFLSSPENYRKLDLSGQGIRDSELASIASALASNSTLQGH